MVRLDIKFPTTYFYDEDMEKGERISWESSAEDTTNFILDLWDEANTI